MDTLLKSKDEIKDSFNKIVLILCTHLANKYPDTDFGKYKITINKYVTDFPYEPIANFIKFVYSNDTYRNKILAGDESFFLNQTYDEHQDVSSHIFMMKDIWVTMDQSNKTFVKNTFKSLVERTTLYIDVLCEINKLKKK
jgi:hypothetical protein